MVGLIVTLTLFFRHGYEIHSYDKTELNATQQSALLDDYNSYSGNIASIFGKPIEMFVTAGAQVIVLCFFPASLLRAEPSWKAVYAALALSAAAGYLISNGFNSLNVQLRDLKIQPVVKASDLSRNDTANTLSDWSTRVTTVTQSVSEAQPQNPIANTVLRNLVLPQAVRAKSACSDSEYFTVQMRLPTDNVVYGFPPRDWMQQLLPEALPAKVLRLVLNPTNQTANDSVKSEDLPMNASIAANLALYAHLLSADAIPLLGGAWSNPAGKTSETKPDVSAAEYVGILPPDPSASETAQREWFLTKVEPFLTSGFNATINMTLTDIPMTFSHVKLAPNIVFDAVTLEVDVAPQLLAEVVNEKDGTRYMTSAVSVASSAFSYYGYESFSCDPWPARCAFKKRDPVMSSTTVDGDLWRDAPAQIQAYLICLNANGTEAMQASAASYAYGTLRVDPCVRTSTSSMLLVSVGKRIVADALIQNASANATGLYSKGSGDVATNLRKIYSLTIGRISWTTSDIARDFSATCDVGSGQSCEGLVLELNQTRQDAKPQRLIVSASALPFDGLLQPMLLRNRGVHPYIQRPLTLVQVNEPLLPSAARLEYRIAAGDLLHPHNIRNLTWDLSRKRPRDMCKSTEERVQRVLDNHMYIEHPLQATYTAAVFFLFQNAVVRDAVAVDESSITLAFDGNIQQVVLFISIPPTNSLLTLLGCLVLVLGVAATLSWAFLDRTSIKKKNPLDRITDGEVIARVKLDDSTFPSLLLHRHVTSASEENKQPRCVDQFVISSLSLQDPEGDRESDTEDTSHHGRGSVAV